MVKINSRGLDMLDRILTIIMGVTVFGLILIMLADTNAANMFLTGVI
jgi:hypothetical protein